MKRTKEIVVFVVALLILVFTINDVSATSGGNTDWNSLLNPNNTSNNSNTGNTNSNTNDTYQNINIVNNTNTNTNTENNVVNVVNNTNVNANTNTSVPYTGIDNTSILVIIGICGISAIYAYKKIRDYNIK